MNPVPGPKTRSVPALERGLLVLEYLAQSRRGVTVSQLARKLRFPRSTAHALLLTYQRSGYVKRDERAGRYCLGFRLQALANMALGGMTLRGHAGPVLFRLMQETGLTVHLAVMEKNEAILIDRIAPPGTPPLATWVGKRMGLHCTGLGKALLAHLSQTEAEELIIKQGMIRHNENTIASKRTLKLACEQVRQLGYAVDDEEEEIGIRCIGAPVFGQDGEVVAAISVSGPKGKLDDIASSASRVKQSAAALSMMLRPFPVPSKKPPRRAVPPVEVQTKKRRAS